MRQRVKDKRYYSKILISDECTNADCGREKTKGYVFCHICFYKLPEKKRRALYKKMGRGFEQAVDDAVVYLRDET